MDELQEIGPGSLGSFLRRWYGLQEPAGPGNESIGEGLPAPLAWWYRLVGERSGEVAGYYDFVPRPELVVEGDVVPFCRAPHDGGFQWGFGRAGVDPATFESEDGVHWEPTGHGLSALLLYIAVSSAVLAARYGLVTMASRRDNYAAVVSMLRPLRPDIWSWPEPAVRFYCADGVLAQAGHTGGDFGYQVIMAATSEDRLDRFRHRQWEWASGPGPLKLS